MLYEVITKLRWISLNSLTYQQLQKLLTLVVEIAFWWTTYSIWAIKTFLFLTFHVLPSTGQNNDLATNRITSYNVCYTKLLRYLKYAFGEIILVMIGILLALQVNNWNENRKAVKAQKRLLINLYEDLGSDSIFLEDNRQSLLRIIKTQRQIQAVRKGQLKSTDINSPQSIRGSFRNFV